MYGEDYGYRSGLNRAMVDHLAAKVAQLKRTAGLCSGDIVLDIGSNDGTTLSFYTEAGVERIGIDPTARKFRQYYDPGVEVVEDFFTAAAIRARKGDRKAKIVTSIAMFYDLDDPLTFARDVHDVLADDGIWHLEQSYLPAMIAASAYDTICHEHVEYYALRQIEWLCERANLRVIDVARNFVNGGSFAVTVCKQSAPYAANTDALNAMRASETALGLDSEAPYRRFVDAIERHREALRDLLGDLRARSQRVLGYGASTKGNVVLQYCGLTTDDIAVIAEVNADKFGKFTPGTLISIVSEADARAMSPDYFVVLPWHFRDVIIEREAEFLRKGGKLVFPLPEISIVEG